MRTIELIAIVAISMAALIMADEIKACEPKNILVIGQSNAGYLSQLDLAGTWGTVDCRANIFTSVRGGTGISAFMPSWSTASLYGRTSAAIENAGAKLDAIVFWQGEQDSKTAETAKEWPGLATQVLQSYRVEYGASKDIPIFMFALNSFHQPTEKFIQYWSFIRNRQFSMQRKGITVIDTSGYEFKGDLVHLTTAGYQQAADAVAKLLYPL